MKRSFDFWVANFVYYPRKITILLCAMTGHVSQKNQVLEIHVRFVTSLCIKPTLVSTVQKASNGKEFNEKSHQYCPKSSATLFRTQKYLVVTLFMSDTTIWCLIVGIVTKSMELYRRQARLWIFHQNRINQADLVFLIIFLSLAIGFSAVLIICEESLCFSIGIPQSGLNTEWA